MSNSNKDSSWPYQRFHNANRSKNQHSKNNNVWESNTFKYNSFGQIKKIEHKHGVGGTKEVPSHLYETRYEVGVDRTKKTSVSFSFKR